MSEKNKGGRPSIYTPQLADIFCTRLASGESMRSICLDDDMPDDNTIFRWLAKDPQFREQYAQAREIWADAEFENMMRIADTPQVGEKEKITDEGTEITRADMIEHRRLQVDTRKWALARMSPKKYGEKQHVEVNNTGTVMHITTDVSAVCGLITQLASKGPGIEIQGDVSDRPVLPAPVRTE